MSTVSFEFLKAELSGEQKARVDSYLNSPLYYLLTGRKGARLYKNHHSAVVVCAHPHIQDRLLVFPEIGKADYELTASVLNMLNPPKNGVQLARYSEEEIKALQQRLSKLSYTNVSGLSDYQMVALCRDLDERGIRYVNVGGSETRSLDAFKAKYQPEETLKILSADVMYRKPETSNIEVHELVAEG